MVKRIMPYILNRPNRRKLFHRYAFEGEGFSSAIYHGWSLAFVGITFINTKSMQYGKLTSLIAYYSFIASARTASIMRLLFLPRYASRFSLQCHRGSVAPRLIGTPTAGKSASLTFRFSISPTFHVRPLF